MGSPDLFKALNQTLGAGQGQTLPVQDVRLTPYLSVVVAILYMMAVDGDISDRESSQLQSVIGADDTVLRRAVAYAQSHDIDQFLREAPPMLDEGGRLCLLINVADSLMADGELQKVELALFDRMLAAFGQTKQHFQPHFDAIAAKGRTSVLGNFDAAAISEEMTPPKALVVAMLYMMSADGEMAPEEVGRLSAAIGGSQALLKASLRYVSQVRAPQFLALATDILDKRQRLCILLNACDAMMSDRQVVAAERELLGRMMLAFGIDAGGLQGYLNTMSMKNELPVDVARARAPSKPASSIGPRRNKKQEEGVVFERKKTWQEETGEASAKGREERQSAAAGEPGAKGDSPLDSRIFTTMQDNIDRMSDGMQGDVTLADMERQARADAPEIATARKPKGPADRRALKDGEGDSQLRAERDGQGASKLRTASDADGASDLRAERDGSGAAKTRSLADAEGGKDQRSATDHQRSGDGRAIKDAKAGADHRALNDGKGPSDLRAAADRQAESDARKAIDARGPTEIRTALDASGPSDMRTAVDADAPSDVRNAVDANGPKDLRTALDADGPELKRTALDASGAPLRSAMRDARMQDSSRHWQDAGLPGDIQALSDAEALPLGKHLVDDRRAFDGTGPEDADELDGAAPIVGRMGAVRDRTHRIREHVEALRRSRTLGAGSRLPALPPGPPRPVIDDRPAITLASSEVSNRANTIPDSERMLLASDAGGPRMSEQTPAATPEEATTNRRLRFRSAVLLPALFLTYGATMVGEGLSERLFITNENMATDARIVHQMASVQQSVYRIAPEAVQLPAETLAVANAGATAAVAGGAAVTGASNASGDEAQTDREKAESFLEQRKRELMEKFKQHQSSSALAAERQQWFVYAKSIVLLGLGMTFWGVLFRSLRMLHGSTAAGLIGLLLSANGYWLFVRF